MVKIIRFKQTWKVLGTFSGKSYCLEKLAYSKGYRVTDICAALGCGQRQLYTIFLRDIGLPPKQWLDLERMVVAKRKLEGGKSIREVASDMGYTSAVAFGRRFERTYGFSPGRFVKRRWVFISPPNGWEEDPPAEGEIQES